MPDDDRWMQLAVELAGKCPPSDDAYSVGAVIVSAGQEIARGYSRESDAHVHAEEAALAKLIPGDPRLCGATIYSSLEPCARRASRPDSCVQLITATGIRRLVIAWREPPVFVRDAHGADELAKAGVEVVELPAYEAQARRPNEHLTPGGHAGRRA